MKGCSVEFLEELVPQRLGDEEHVELIRDIDLGEIRSALFSIKDDKTPGPDGYSSCFFKKA